MNISYLPPESLKKSVFQLVNDCREKLSQGEISIPEMEQAVQAYCESINLLPLEEGRLHKESLHELMELIKKLESELCEERDRVNREVQGLEQMRKANIAYYTTERSIPFTKKDDNES